MSEALDLYRNRKTGDFSIQRYAGIYAIGRFIKISPAKMQECGLEIILKCLKERPSLKTDEAPELNIFSKDEKKEFYRQHRHIFLEMSSNAYILIGPMHRKGSGFVAPKDEIITLSLPSTNEIFLDVLNHAYEML